MASEEPSGIRSVVAWLRARLTPDAPSSVASPNAANAPSPVSPAPSTPDVVLSGLDAAALLDFARTAPLVYGRWREWKWLYKHVEAQAATGQANLNLLGVLAGRLDAAPLTPPRNGPEPFADPADTEAHWNAPRLTISGNRAYVVTTQYGGGHFYIFDVSDPVAPALLGKLTINGIQKAVVDGNRAYAIASGYNNQRLYALDIADARNPRILGWMSLEEPKDIAADGGRVWAISGSVWQNSRWSKNALHEIDVSAPTRLASLGKLDITDAQKVFVQNGRAVVVSGPNYATGYGTTLKIHLVTVSDPRRMQIVNSYQIKDVTGAAFHGDYLLVSAGSSTYGYGSPTSEPGLHVLDISRLPNIVRVAYLNVGEATSVSISGDQAVVAVNQRRQQGWGFASGSLRIFNIANPASPIEVGALASMPVYDVKAGGGYAYALMQPKRGYTQKLRVIDIQDLARPLLTGDPPTRQTIGYMKRRARRALRQLSQSNPEQWTTTAASALLVSGAGRKSVDPVTNWLAMDLLFGGSDRWAQMSHGRGAYKLVRPRFVFRRREERSPEIWNAHADALLPVLTTPDLPPEMYAFAVNVWLDLKRPLPDLSPEVRESFLLSLSPRLISLATRHVTAQFAAGEFVSPATVADAFVRGSARLRQQIESTLASRMDARNAPDQVSVEWQDAFAERLMVYTWKSPTGNAQARRQNALLLLLVTRFPDFVTQSLDVELALRMVGSGRDVLVSAALDFVRAGQPAAILPWLAGIETLPPALREPALLALFAGVTGKELPYDPASSPTNAASAWVREQGWQLLEASAMPTDLIRLAWLELLSQTSLTPALETALSAPAALRLLERAGLTPEQLAGLIESRPFLVGVLSPAAMTIFVRSLSPDATLPLVASVPENKWPDLRSALQNAFDTPARLESFWQAAFAVLDLDSVLYARLVTDTVMRESFRRVVNADEFLKIGNPAVGELLREWLDSHEAETGRDSTFLLLAAIHPLPAVRDWGLARMKSLGFGLPFALRLFESELPPAVAVGQRFFEAVPPDDTRTLEYAVALCDSPHHGTRAYGRQYALQRWNNLPHDVLLSRLAENPDPATQAWVAERGLEQPDALAPVAAQFDRDVLRSRDQARKAKELVKRRITTQPVSSAPDIATLLEMARSRTPRDSEWAMQQLVRLALEGREIDGVTVG